MSEEAPGGRTNKVPGLAPYLYWGGAVGLISAFATLFVVSVYYGETLGLGHAACVLVGCALTVMLSQPAGLMGLAVGALCGALCGLIGHSVRHRLRRG